jgi:PII-like signaling protein
MTIEGPALRLRLYIGEADRWHGRPLSEAIVLRLRELGLAGATVVRGIEGFGRNAHLHTAKILRLSEDLPIVIDVVDTEERIRGVLPEIDAMVGDGLITLEPVEVVAYRASGPNGDGSAKPTGGTPDGQSEVPAAD